MTAMIDLVAPAGGFRLATCERLVAESPLAEEVRKLAGGPLGTRALLVEALERLAAALDLAQASRSALEAEMLERAGDAARLDVPALSGAQREFSGALLVVVASRAFEDWAVGKISAPAIEDVFELDGLSALLCEDSDRLAKRLSAVLAGFLRHAAGKRADGESAEEAALRALLAGFLLLARTVRRHVEGGPLRLIESALDGDVMQFGSVVLRGLAPALETSEPADGLLHLTVDDIVGNREYLDAAMRLARDVAGFDLESRSNPKRINPVLFGLGRPGCGKTVTAHAVGRYFLEFCRERGVAAQFVVVRRSDWASSYQNASAANLICLFKEKVRGFEGVTGLYWPDIDTALASRDASGLRAEEKQNLGAVFGVFDGTLLPKDGSWFLMCDANTMHMDEAAISRIAQNPMTVSGPTSPEEYVRLMRDVCLRDQRDNLRLSDAEWHTIGESAVRHQFSGRNVEAVCGNVRAHIQDFEYPDEYFEASHDERRRLVGELSREVGVELLAREVSEYAAFHQEAQRRDEDARFDREVDAMVLQLNAGRAAAVSLAEKASAGMAE